MNRLKIILIFVFLILFSIVFFFNTIYKNNQISIELKNSVQNLKLHYDITSYYNKKKADSAIYSLRHDKNIINLLSKSLDANKEEKKIIRKKIYKAFEERFNILKKEGLFIAVFADANNNAFLRMHKPDKYGDTLKYIRHSITLVNKTKKPAFGFEQGKISHAFRNVYPLYDEKKRYLGCLDLAFSSEFMQETIDRINKVHTHFLVKKDIIDRRIWQTKEIDSTYKPSIVHTNFMVSEVKEDAHKNKKARIRIIAQNKKFIEEKLNSLKEFSIYGKSNQGAMIISFVPIVSIKDKNSASAYIVSFTLNDEIPNILNSFYIINSISFVLLLIVIYLVYKQLIHKKELSLQVDEKTKELKHLNENLEEKILIATAENREKDKQIFEQAKNVQMGEMIGNIAHQWRQPLSLISTIASGLKFKLEFNTFELEDGLKDLDKLNDTSQYLSKTIDIFGSFVKDIRNVKRLDLQDIVEYSLSFVKTLLSDNNIKLIDEIDYSKSVEVKLVEGGLQQVLINILNNSIDALKNSDEEDRWIKVNLEINESIVLLTIEDSAGGISPEIISKIFNPYFTTKHQAQGTGIGLYMSHQIIESYMKGKMYVKNTNNGAKFFIELPKTKEENS